MSLVAESWVAGWGGGPHGNHLVTGNLAGFLCVMFFLVCEGHDWPAASDGVTLEIVHLGPQQPSLGSSQLVRSWALPRGPHPRLPSLYPCPQLTHSATAAGSSRLGAPYTAEEEVFLVLGALGTLEEEDNCPGVDRGTGTALCAQGGVLPLLWP